ncbi:hypothetical protein ONS96_003785 [Cadophora gregata f. sp. sojae]|nr:hypothetical protein ONS96_003785 [Cadophora gregata f. sp. sojae]
MKFLSVALLALIGTSVAMPLNPRASTAPKKPSTTTPGAAAKTSAPAAKASAPATAANNPPATDAPATIQGNSNAAMVMYAAGAFANDAMTVSASLNTLGTEVNGTHIHFLLSY